MKLYLVGGTVRDRLLGLDPKDIDYAVEAKSFLEMKQYLLDNKYTIFLEKEEFGSIRARSVNGEAADFTLCRSDGIYSDHRRPDSITIGDIYQDLARRDFTVNSCAIDIQTQQIIDPFNGQADIKEKVIRCVGNTDERFNEDYLRILRAIRFAITKNFTLSVEIWKWLWHPQLHTYLQQISKERIYEELNKCFRSDTLITLSYIQDFSYKTQRWLWSQFNLQLTIQY